MVAIVILIIVVAIWTGRKFKNRKKESGSSIEQQLLPDRNEFEPDRPEPNISNNRSEVPSSLYQSRNQKCYEAAEKRMIEFGRPTKKRVTLV